MIRKKILVPVNFDQESDAALNYAGILARTINGMITCLHVIEERGSSPKKSSSGITQQQIRREAEQRLAVQVNSIITDKYIPFEIIVSEGEVDKKIIEKASDLNATFIIMGRSVKQELKKYPNGSYTYYVITHAKIPVITVKENKQDSIGQIVLPLDLSKPLEHKINRAIEMAGVFNAVINILSILSYDLVSKEKKYETRLKEIRKEIMKLGITCSTRLVISRKSLAEEIIIKADQYENGMILLITQRDKNTEDFFIGSTAREIIQKTGLPVMNIMPEVEKMRSPLEPVPAMGINPD